MKTGQIRLLIFSISLIVALLINVVFLDFLFGYKMLAFLLILLLFFKFYFVFEKDRHRYLNDIIFEIFLFVTLYFILYYLLGLIVGLARTSNYYSFYGITNFIIPMIMYCILREIFRYNMLCKADGGKICTTIVVLLFMLFDLSFSFHYSSFNSNFEIFRFIALTLLPIVSRNISYSYISKKMGYKPIIIFDLIFTLYPYLIPLVPNPSEYIVSIINLIVPILFAFRILKFFDLKKDDKISSDYHKKHFKGIILPLLIVIIMVYFHSGYFRFYAIAIASGSMSPNIEKGDIVVVDKEYGELNENDVIAFKHNNVIIVHRLVKKIKIGDSYYYYTKGDANNSMDDFVIEKDIIIGKVDFKLPLIGYPTVWLNGN